MVVRLLCGASQGHQPLPSVCLGFQGLGIGYAHTPPIHLLTSERGDSPLTLHWRRKTLSLLAWLECFTPVSASASGSGESGVRHQPCAPCSAGKQEHVPDLPLAAKPHGGTVRAGVTGTTASLAVPVLLWPCSCGLGSGHSLPLLSLSHFS